MASYFRARIYECTTDRCRDQHVESLLNIISSCRGKDDFMACLAGSSYRFHKEDKAKIVEYSESDPEHLKDRLEDLFLEKGQAIANASEDPYLICLVGFDGGRKIYDPICIAHHEQAYYF